MAKQNFLNASFSGKLGGVVGLKTKGGNAIRVQKQFICHNGEKSKNALTAFTCLHRLCCKLAPALSDTLLKGLRPSQRIQTLEGILKSWIKDNSFPPNGILNLKGLQLSPRVENPAYDEYQFLVTFDFVKGDILPRGTTAEVMFFIYNEAGQVKAVHFFPYQNGKIYMQLSGMVEHNLHLAGGILLTFLDKTQFISPFYQNIYNWIP